MVRRSREHKPESPVKTKQRARRPPRTPRLFDGVPEPGSELYSADDHETSAQKKKAPRTLFADTVASRGGGEHAMAILIPGLLGLAGFLLAAATLLRRRRTH